MSVRVRDVPTTFATPFFGDSDDNNLDDPDYNDFVRLSLFTQLHEYRCLGTRSRSGAGKTLDRHALAGRETVCPHFCCSSCDYLRAFRGCRTTALAAGWLLCRECTRFDSA